MEDFVALVRALVANLRAGREEWPNGDTKKYLWGPANTAVVGVACEVLAAEYGDPTRLLGLDGNAVAVLVKNAVYYQ